LAFQYLERALQQKPDLGQAHRDLGKALLQTDGDLVRAMAHLKKVTELAPDEPTTHYLLAQLYRKQGKKAEQAAELATFEKLRRAQQEKEQGARTASPAGEAKTTEEFPPDPDVPKE